MTRPRIAIIVLEALIAFAFALAVMFTLHTIAAAAEGDEPVKPTPFRPWQQVWQCNDIRVTVTSLKPFEVNYDIGGTIWGGSQFTMIAGDLYFNGRPCVPIPPPRQVAY